MKHTEDLKFLDGLRGLAALYVVIGHCRWLLWEGFTTGYLKHPDTYGPIAKGAMYAISLFKYGHEAVQLFFVLSGFVIHLRYSREIALKGSAATFDFWPYFVRRFRRIYPPLLLAIVVTYLVDILGAYLGYNIYSHTTPYQDLNANITTNHDLKTLFGNLVFYAKLGFVNCWGTNGSLWSLTFEWWFYMLYPGIFWLSKKRFWLPAIPMLLFTILSVQFAEELNYAYWKVILQAIFIWWLGNLLADIYTGRAPIPYWVLSPLIVFVILGPTDVLHIPYRWLAFMPLYYTGIGFTGLMAFCFWLQKRGIALRPLIALNWLGTISYSLYALHLPFIVLFSGFLMSQDADLLLPASQWYIFLAAVTTLLIGYIGYRIAEKPFIKSR